MFDVPEIARGGSSQGKHLNDLRDAVIKSAQGEGYADQRGKQENDLVGPGRDHQFLEQELAEVGEGLQQPEGPDHIRPFAHLDAGEELAIAPDP